MKSAVTVDFQTNNFRRWVSQFNVSPTSVVHVGGHLGQEAALYHELKFEPVTWFEALEDIANGARILLAELPLQKVITATLWSKSGLVKNFFRASNGSGSSSLLPFFLHKASHPDVYTSETISVVTSTLDEELGSHLGKVNYGLLVLDTQGSELEIIKGSEVFLKEVKYIMCELSVRELYKDCPLESDIVKYLDSRNFQYAGCKINLTTGWGDGFFIRKDVIVENCIVIEKNNFIYEGRRIALGTSIRGFLVRIGLPVTKVSRQEFFKVVKRLSRRQI